jgi:transposase
VLRLDGGKRGPRFLLRSDYGDLFGLYAVPFVAVGSPNERRRMRWCVRLCTAPGVGVVTAVAFRATLDEAGRFRGAHQVECYLGLVPREMSSGEKQHRGRITKSGNARARWLLVEAAWAVWRSRTAETAPLRAWAQRIASRR